MMTANKTILVTGASGFIAQHVILALLDRGYDIRGTVRDLKRAEDVLKVLQTEVQTARSRVAIVAADLEQDAGWDAAMQGVSAVMHVASPIPLEQPDDPDSLVAPARDGALRVLRAARAAGVPKVVMTSSVVAVAEGHGKDRGRGRTFTEADWTDPDGPHVNPYARSKVIAERAAWDYVYRVRRRSGSPWSMSAMSLPLKLLRSKVIPPMANALSAPTILSGWPTSPEPFATPVHRIDLKFRTARSLASSFGQWEFSIVPRAA
jgi:nucleoside-diphosphate-sugar epimerase